eukprot:288488_1
MTENPTDQSPPTEISKLSINFSSSPQKLINNNHTHQYSQTPAPDANSKSPPQLTHHNAASKSESNLLDIESSPSNTPQSASMSGTAYTYATSTLSGAYSYMSSFYGSTQPDQSDIKPQSDSKSGDQIHVQNGYKTSPYDASIPDLIKYPLSTQQNASSHTDLAARLEEIESHGIDNAWSTLISQPSPSSVKLRSISYLNDRVKEYGNQGDVPIFGLAAAQAFKSDAPMDHIAAHPCSWFKQNIMENDMSCFTIVIHLQVRSLKTSFVTYHVLQGDSLCGYNAHGTPIIRGHKAVTKLFDIVLNCGDHTVLNNKMKLIPRIVSGPYPVKRVVENRPVLLGNKVPLSYFRGANYFEIDAKVDDTMVASSIIKLCHRFSKRIVVDMAWTIQGDHVT